MPLHSLVRVLALPGVFKSHTGTPTAADIASESHPQSAQAKDARELANRSPIEVRHSAASDIWDHGPRPGPDSNPPPLLLLLFLVDATALQRTLGTVVGRAGTGSSGGADFTVSSESGDSEPESV